MGVLKRNKTIILILLIIAIILAVSVVFFVQSTLKPSPAPSPSSTPTSSPLPTKNSPTPTIKPTSTPTPTSIPTSTFQPSPSPNLFPDEVTQYQGQNLTPIGAYIDYLYLHPDVAIHGAQYLDQATYQLAITGLVNYPASYSYDDVVNNFNSTLEVATLPCVEGWSVTLLWQGIPITNLLQHSGVSPNAKHSFSWHPTATLRRCH